MWIFIILLVLIISFFIVIGLASHKEETTYARLKNRPSNVKMKYTDSKLAEFKRGDKGQVFDTNDITKVINGYPNKYFNVIFENGKKLLVPFSYIEWVSYIDTKEYSDISIEDKKEYLD